MTNESVDPAPRRLGAKIGRIAFLVVAGIMVVAVAVAFFVVWTIQRSFPQTSGELEVDGLQSQVTVQRDALGVPTITADSSEDLFYAQGYVHAQDRFFEMDFRRHVTSGRVAEMFGESQAATDMFLRTLGWHEVAEQEVEALDEATRSYYESYADGVNAYLAENDGAQVSSRVCGSRNTEPRLRDRALGSGGFGRLAEGHGLGSAQQPGGRDRARDARRRHRR